MYAHEFNLMLESPVLITDVGGGDPNSEIGLPYIPGSTLRGALAERYLAAGKGTEARFYALFIQGGIHFLNAYLATPDGSQRMLPAPLAWQRPKDAAPKDDLEDFSVLASIADKTYKGIGGQYWAACPVPDAAPEILLAAPQRQIAVHIARKSRQRPSGPGSTVFRYDALAPGQTLRAVLLAEHEADLEEVVDLLPDGQQLRVGRSQNGGYGAVRVHYAPARTLQQDSTWSEYTPIGATKARLVVTLLSDALIQDKTTGAYVASLQPVLNRAHQSAFVRTHVVGGFNRKWNLPLPQALAIAGGSVFVFAYDEALDQQLQSLIESGIGQRTAEGFGRLAVNLHCAPALSPCCEHYAAAKNEEEDEDERDALTGDAGKMAQVMLRRRWRAEAEQMLVRYLNDYPISNRPEKAQLSRLRNVARQTLEPAHLAKSIAARQLTPMTAFLPELRNTAREQLRRAYIRDQRLLDWLEVLAHKPNTIWDELGIAERRSQITLRGEQATDTIDDAIHFAVRLIDAVAQRAAPQEDDNE